MIGVTVDVFFHFVVLGASAFGIELALLALLRCFGLCLSLCQIKEVFKFIDIQLLFALGLFDVASDFIDHDHVMHQLPLAANRKLSVLGDELRLLVLFDQLRPLLARILIFFDQDQLALLVLPAHKLFIILGSPCLLVLIFVILAICATTLSQIFEVNKHLLVDCRHLQVYELGLIHFPN